jgi:hypothetical protein
MFPSVENVLPSVENIPPSVEKYSQGMGLAMRWTRVLEADSYIWLVELG